MGGRREGEREGREKGKEGKGGLLQGLRGGDRRPCVRGNVAAV